MTRVAVVDIGTNSTRLLIADVDPATKAVSQVERRSNVTRLGQGVDSSGELAPDAIARVRSTLGDYRAAIEAHGAEVTTGVLTSAVRDAANGSDFTRMVRDDYGIDARTIDGDEEAQLSFLGATSEREAGGPEPLVVIDIGGGSTEFVVGDQDDVSFHVSTQAGVVRQTERHIHNDPPEPDEVRALAEEVRTIIAGAVPAATRRLVQAAIAVAGTATSCAAIDLALDPYDPTRVHGHVLALPTCELLLARLAAMTDEHRRQVKGLHPDRAPTIVAGVVMLIEALRAFGLHEVEVSENDILRGAALRVAGAA